MTPSDLVPRVPNATLAPRPTSLPTPTGTRSSLTALAKHHHQRPELPHLPLQPAHLRLRRAQLGQQGLLGCGALGGRGRCDGLDDGMHGAGAGWRGGGWMCVGGGGAVEGWGEWGLR